MSEPFIGEIKIFGGNFSILGWAFCDGQLLSISQNDALYTLIGTTYGGDGVNTFGLPDLRGRVPIHVSQNHPQGEKAGTETVTLSPAQLPKHTHTANGSLNAGQTQTNPTDGFWSRDPGGKVAQYRSASNNLMDPGTIDTAGGFVPHNNLQPFLVLNFLIALGGIFPPHN